MIPLDEPKDDYDIIGPAVKQKTDDKELIGLYISEFQWRNVDAHTYAQALDADYQDFLSLRLRAFSFVLPESVRDPRVRTFYSQLYDIRNEKRESLRRIHAAGMVWGSFYFGDPSINCDIDMEILALDESDNPDKILEKTLEDVESRAIATIARDAHGEIHYLKEFLETIDGFPKGAYTGDLRKDTFVDISNLLIISKEIYLSDSTMHETMAAFEEARLRIFGLAEENPVYRAILIGSLHSMINNRSVHKRPARESFLE